MVTQKTIFKKNGFSKKKKRVSLSSGDTREKCGPQDAKVKGRPRIYDDGGGGGGGF